MTLLTSDEHALVRDFPKWKFRFSGINRKGFAVLKESPDPIKKIKVSSASLGVMRAVLPAIEKGLAEQAKTNAGKTK